MLVFPRLLYLSFCLFAYSAGAFAQSPVLKHINGLPSREIYDLLTDSKGFLWIAHNSGISKYDGINFTNFSNPQQSSLSTTGLLEDSHGRVWLNNFTGQILYIENGKMKKLDAYKTATENYFPRIGLFKDQLVATTRNGLFICNTNTLACHYESYNDPHKTGTTSLSILKNEVIAYGNGNWFIYRPGKGIKRAVFNSSEKTLIKSNSSMLTIKPFKDTLLMFANPAGILYKMVAVNDTIKICGKEPFEGFINTVSVMNDRYWVNSTSGSKAFPGNSPPINGYNLSSIAIDKENHHWYGSLQQGLITDSLISNTSKNSTVFRLDNDDVMRCMVKHGSKLLLGTQNGELVSYDSRSRQSELLTALPSKHGGISYLKILNGHQVWIGTSVNTYLFDLESRRLTLADPVRSLKQAEQMGSGIVLASSNSLIVLPGKQSEAHFEEWKSEFTRKYKGLTAWNDTSYKFLMFEKRTRAVCYSAPDQTIWASLKDGLYTINSKGIVPYYFNGAPVYASCLTSCADGVVAGTFNNGVLIVKGNDVRHLTVDDGLLSNNILHIKVIGNNLWIFTNGSVQVFELKTLKPVNKYTMPGINDAFLTDAEEVDDKCYFTALNGLHALSPVKHQNDSISVYLNSLFINRRDTAVIDNLVLPYYDNDVQISVGTPYLLSARDIFIKYRLHSRDSAKWVYSRAGERNFHFASLAPGSYLFEALAIKPQTGLSSGPLVINFIIRPPWWQTWWFRLLLIVALLLIIAGFSRSYYINMLARQKAEFEKALVAERERQHISREIHDHIGQVLSVIKLNLNMADPSQIAETKEIVDEAVSDLRQFTHGLYYGKLLTDSLVEVIKKDIERLNIKDQLSAKLEVEWEETILTEQSELLVYRVFQEAINNILKHAGAKNITVKIASNRKRFILTIGDDGRGFLAKSLRGGLGLNSMYKRAELLNGELHVSGFPAKGSKVELIINHPKS